MPLFSTLARLLGKEEKDDFPFDSKNRSDQETRIKVLAKTIKSMKKVHRMDIGFPR